MQQWLSSSRAIVFDKELILLGLGSSWGFGLQLKTRKELKIIRFLFVF